MASGLPIVAYNYAASAEHIEDGVTGLLADYADARRFIEQAVRLAAAPDLAALFRVGVRNAAEKLDWRCVVRRIEAILFAAAEMPALTYAGGRGLGPRTQRALP